MLKFSVSDTEFSFLATLLTEENPCLINLVYRHMPLYTVLSHCIISGDAFLMPSAILSLERGLLARRKPGALYFDAPRQTICICCGDTAEDSAVNQFGQVLETDIRELERLAKHVDQKTFDGTVKVEVTLTGDSAPAKNLPRNLPALLGTTH